MKLTYKINNLLNEDAVKSQKRVIANSKSAIAVLKLQANNDDLSDSKREQAKEAIKGWQEKLKAQQDKLKELMKK